MMITLKQFAAVPVGINSERLLTMRMQLSKTGYPSPAQRIQFMDQVLNNMAALPGVTSSAFTSNLPLTGLLTDVISIEGRPAPSRSDILRAGKQAITPDFFKTVGVRLIKGRQLEDTDRENSEFVTVINEEMARQVFPTEDPIGKRLKHGHVDDPFPWIKVVGVVSIVRQLGPEGSSTPVMFLPYPQITGEYIDVLARDMSLMVKTSTDPDLNSSAIRGAIWSLDHDMPISDVRTMDSLIDDSIQQPRVRATLMGAFAAFALIIAAVGLYGVVSQSVLQRRHELGIRMALGAKPKDIRVMVLKGAMTLALIGVVLGAVGALVFTRLLSGLLFGVSTNDPATFVLVSAILLIVAAAASYIPAHRATRVDPLTALRAG